MIKIPHNDNNEGISSNASAAGLRPAGAPSNAPEERRIVSKETMNDATKAADNYQQWVFDSFRWFLKRGAALEIGSGHGRYSKKMIQYVDELLVTDIDPVAIDEIKNELYGLGRIKYMVMDGIDEKRFESKKVDNIVLINVLEHIEDDSGFLRSCREIMNPDGRLVVFVPAFQLLYSRIDQQVGHFRRYSMSVLQELLDRHDFVTDHIRYFNFVGFFGWYFNKLIGSDLNSDKTNAQISLYNKLIPWLKYADRFMRFPGQSILALARKK